MKKWFSLLLVPVMMLSLMLAVAAEPDSEFQTRAILMEATYDDGVILATLVDDQHGTMSNWPVSLIIDGETIMTENTDYEGMVVLEYDIPHDAQLVECYAHDGGFDVYTFTGCTVYIDNYKTEDAGEEEGTTAPPTDDESEDETPPTTTTTIPVVTQPGMLTSPITTTVQNERVAIGVDAERALLTVARISDSEFSSKARLWMDASVYNYHVPDTQSSLHLQLSLNNEASEPSKLVAAKNSDSRFSSYTDSEVIGFVMDTSIVYVDATSRVPLDFQDGNYTIEIPLPATMRNCKTIAIAAYTASGTPKFEVYEPINGCLRFNVKRLQTFMILGLGDRGKVVNSLTETPTLLWVTIGVGATMIVGGILLLVFVTFRRKQVGVETAKETIVVDSHDYSEAVAEDIDDTQVIKSDVVMDYDVQTTLTDEELMRFRSKPEVDEGSFDAIKKEVVPSGKQPVAEQDFLSLDDSQENGNLNDLFDDMLNDLEDM